MVHYLSLASCAHRDISSVITENEGLCTPDKLHLDCDEIRLSRYHQLRKVDGDESDESDEWDLDESGKDEWECPSDLRYDYRDYRRMQRSAFFIRVLEEREDKVRVEMKRWGNIMEAEGGKCAPNCHDLSLENVFVDEKDCTKIVSGLRRSSFNANVNPPQTCIIDGSCTPSGLRSKKPIRRKALLKGCRKPCF